MISRYGIFIKVIENSSFTKTAEVLGYSQSAISQTVHSLEKELGVTLVNRGKNGITLTSDGTSFLPYFRTIYSAEESLKKKKEEMDGLENSTIRIGTFTSVSRNILPKLMKEFKIKYPNVHFVLQQGEYTSIEKWIQEGSIDFGFVNKDAVTSITVKPLYRDEMVAVLPLDHPLAKEKILSLNQLVNEPFILLDEGQSSVPLDAFNQLNLSPNIEYKVYDDYSILSMIRQNLGISILYELVVTGFVNDLAVIPIKESLGRTVSLAWNNLNTMPLAARRFAEFIIKNTKTILYK